MKTVKIRLRRQFIWIELNSTSSIISFNFHFTGLNSIQDYTYIFMLLFFPSSSKRKEKIIIIIMNNKTTTSKGFERKKKNHGKLNIKWNTNILEIYLIQRRKKEQTQEFTYYNRTQEKKRNGKEKSQYATEFLNMSISSILENLITDEKSYELCLFVCWFIFYSYCCWFIIIIRCLNTTYTFYFCSMIFKP